MSLYEELTHRDFCIFYELDHWLLTKIPFLSLLLSRGEASENYKGKIEQNHHNIYLIP